ncbi:multidrug efflux RND transporter permease subunit [Stappia sp. GBMRC 2046]|uniref:Efflux pump membrane transporter n=1 Tax=Stappia sediminis TaxID=2692190 RepID=A0A7X3LTN9_9HYPH|nr:multidrug efflux RND transporter permease subunit [Stappia sediminis]MXN64909.1 multidrug efflux RND transporter permease subunit [Stappia sediminis]
MLSGFFINRPIFATVLAIAIVLVGSVSMPFLPIGQYPPISPPTVAVSATFTGANARVVEASVTSPLEEQINGVEGMVYMSSVSADDGTVTITVTFETGYDLDIAAVDVQNQVEIAESQLPAEVVQAGITVTKQSSDLTIVPNLYSPDGRYDSLFISNYINIHVLDVLKRIPGVGEVNIFGERKFAMRIWLDPEKMASLGVTVEDVSTAISEQNQVVAAGSLGQPPAPKDQVFQFALTTLGRLETAEQFAEIIVRAEPDGRIVRIGDIGRVDLGAELYDETANVSGEPALPIGLLQLADANSIRLADQVVAEMDRLSNRFPEGLEYEIIYDTTRFVRASIKEVLTTLAIAIVLVISVIFVFLHGIRTTLIPVITIPVCLVGTLAALLALGFSINTLTLFGLVLAVGLVVDDAIVVVENAVRHMQSETIDARLAAANAMKQVTAPIIATSLVLMAVFVPVAFTPGITGKLYEQFALTIAFAVAISAFNSLTLSPALCGVLLRAENKRQGALSRRFDAGFMRLGKGYERVVGYLVRRWGIVVVLFVLALAGTGYLFKTVPTGFVPPEDQGYFIVFVQTPEGTSLQRTQKVVDRVEKELMDTPGMEHVVTFGGFSLINSNSAPNVGTLFPVLKPWSERRRADEQLLTHILPALNAKFSQIPDAEIVAVNPPAIPGLSATGGFTFELQDYSGGSLTELETVAGELIAEASRRPELAGLFTTFSARTPTYRIDLNRNKALSEGVSLDQVFAALQTYLGAYYVNDFNKFGRVYRVYVQAEADARATVEDISRIHVRNAAGDMVPLSGLVSLHEEVGARNITHYNLFRSAPINGEPAPGFSSSQAIQAMEEVAEKVLPDTMGFEWTGNAYQEIKAGNVLPYIFALALAFVFLCLAAQYESWSMPFMVILAVPLAMLGALGAQALRGLENDIYCQIGLIMLIGLASKNAILIVEFARRRRAEGLGIEMAAMEAARIRLRPILMTALAFIFGVAPLVFSSGAGAGARHSLGTAVFGGMFAATLLSLFVVPVFYVLIERFRARRDRVSEG